jgi:hypothetical protein
MHAIYLSVTDYEIPAALKSALTYAGFFSFKSYPLPIVTPLAAVG